MATTSTMIQEGKIGSAASPRKLQGGPKDSGSRIGHQSLTILLSILVAWAAATVAYGKYYTPRSNFGFYLGVAGTLMMLALLAYPLRKRLRWMQRLGALKHWFRIHMWLGILGPTLVLFHSTFHIRSTNAAVALFSMLFVVASGIIGRFVYTKIHYGLYGRRASLQKLQGELFGHSDEVKSRIHFAPQIEERVRQFEHTALEREDTLPLSLVSFMGLGCRRLWIEFRCDRDLHRIMKSAQNPAVQTLARKAQSLLAPYLREIQHVAQFSAYERLFSLWHVLHVPLIFLLAASTIFHVIAVYMY